MTAAVIVFIVLVVTLCAVGAWNDWHAA